MRPRFRATIRPQDKDFTNWRVSPHCTMVNLVRSGRKQILIDLSFIPQEIKEKIINTYEETKPAKGKLLNYFIEHKLKNLMEVIEEF